MSLKNKKHLLAISLPIIIIGICIFWIVRLELNATALASRVDELHNSLKQNKDNLANLESFYREVNKSGITLDNNGGMIFKGDSKIFLNENEITITDGKNKKIGINVDNNHVFMSNEDMAIRIGDVGSKGSSKKGVFINIGGPTQAQLFLGKEKISLIADEKYEVRVGVTGTQKSGISFTKEGTKLELGPNKDFYVNLSHDLQQIELKKGESKITIGETSFSSGFKGTGIYMGEENSGTLAIDKNNGIGMITENGMGLKFESGRNDDFFIDLSPNLNQIFLKKGESQIQMGKTQYGEGIILNRKGSQVVIGQTKFEEGVTIGNPKVGTIGVLDGKGVAIKTHGVGNEMRITGDEKLVITFKGDIDINAYGNLNLNSLNGNVNLVGKRINFNE